MVNATHKLEMVRSAASSRDRRSVTLTFGTSDGKSVDLEFSSFCVPHVIGRLASHLGEVASEPTLGERPSTQLLQTTSMSLAMNAQGGVGLMLNLEGGGELTLGLTPSDLPALRALIDEAIAVSGVAGRH